MDKRGEVSIAKWLGSASNAWIVGFDKNTLAPYGQGLDDHPSRGHTGIPVIFFGGFLLLAGLGTILMDSRKQSNPDWARFAAVTSNIPFAAIAQGRNRSAWGEIGWLRPLIGLAMFAVFFAAHSWLFGARPY